MRLCLFQIVLRVTIMMLNIDYTFLLVFGFRTKMLLQNFVCTGNVNIILFIVMIMFYLNDLLDAIFLV